MEGRGGDGMLWALAGLSALSGAIWWTQIALMVLMASGQGWFVTVHFNAFGEGLLEVILFPILAAAATVGFVAFLALFLRDLRQD